MEHRTSELTMSKTFQLSSDLTSLLPEPLTFLDNAFGGGGEEYDVLTWEHLGPQQIAKLKRLERRLVQNYTILAANVESLNEQQDLEAVAGHVEDDMNAFLALIIPTMPAERWPHIPYKWRYDFLQWWNTEQPAPPKAPKAKAPRNSRRGKPSRDSVRPTG